MSANLLKRLLLVGVIVILGFLFWALDLGRFLNLSFLKGSLEDFRVLQKGRASGVRHVEPSNLPGKP